MAANKQISLILSSSNIYDSYNFKNCTPENGILRTIGNADKFAKDDPYYSENHAIIRWNAELNSFSISNIAQFGTYYRTEKNNLAIIQYGQFLLIGEKTNIVFNKENYQGSAVYIISIMDIDSNLQAQYMLTCNSSVVIGRADPNSPNINTIDIDNDLTCSRKHLVATLKENFVIIKDWGGTGVNNIEEDGHGSMSGTWISIIGSILLKNNMQVRMGKSIFGKFVIS
jgi:hypothetical protein